MDNRVIIKLFSYLRLRQSCIKQEVDMPQIQKCVTRYSSPYWCSVPNIRKLASVVPEKNVTKIILWANLSLSPQYSKSRLRCLVIYVSIGECFVSSKNGKKREENSIILFPILILIAHSGLKPLFWSLVVIRYLRIADPWMLLENEFSLFNFLFFIFCTK